MNQNNEISGDVALLIRIVRGQRVILAADLAGIYGVSAKRLNEQVKRNTGRFPSDFMFRLTVSEDRALRSQIAASSNAGDGLRSQIATSSSGHGGRRYLPNAFTEPGAIMAANVLNSPEAVRMSVFVVRAFLKMREMLTGTRELALQLKKLEAKLTSRLDVHETAIVEVLQRLMEILNPPPEPPAPPKRKIGFHVPAEDGKGGKSMMKK